MATVSPKRAIFRSKTVQKYIQNREKSVLPRIVAPPVFALCWVVLTLLIAAGIITWSGQVPLYITGSGIIAESSTLVHRGTDATAIILFPISNATHLQVGLPILVQVDPAGSGPVVKARVATVSHDPLSPERIHLQYGLVVAEPAIVVTVALGSALAGNLYAGSPVQAQLQIGEQSLLKLFPIINSL
jgi:hypothetical protein